MHVIERNQAKVDLALADNDVKSTTAVLVWTSNYYKHILLNLEKNWILTANHKLQDFLLNIWVILSRNFIGLFLNFFIS